MEVWKKIKSSCNITEIYFHYNPHRFDRPANLYAADDYKKKKKSLRSSEMNFSKTFLGLKVTRYEHNEWKLGKTFRVFVFRKTFQMQMMITQRSHHIQGLARSLQWYSDCMSAEQYELTYRRSRVPEQYLTARKSSYSEWFPMVSKDCRVQRIKRQFPLLHLVQGDTSQIPQTYWLPKIFTDSYKHYLTLTLLISDDFIMYISYS